MANEPPTIRVPYIAYLVVWASLIALSSIFFRSDNSLFIAGLVLMPVAYVATNQIAWFIRNEYKHQTNKVTIISSSWQTTPAVETVRGDPPIDERARQSEISTNGSPTRRLTERDRTTAFVLIGLIIIALALGSTAYNSYHEEQKRTSREEQRAQQQRETERQSAARQERAQRENEERERRRADAQQLQDEARRRADEERQLKQEVEAEQRRLIEAAKIRQIRSITPKLSFPPDGHIWKWDTRQPNAFGLSWLPVVGVTYLIEVEDTDTSTTYFRQRTSDTLYIEQYRLNGNYRWRVRVLYQHDGQEHVGGSSEWRSFYVR